MKSPHDHKYTAEELGIRSDGPMSDEWWKKPTKRELARAEKSGKKWDKEIAKVKKMFDAGDEEGIKKYLEGLKSR